MTHYPFIGTRKTQNHLHGFPQPAQCLGCSAKTQGDRIKTLTEPIRSHHQENSFSCTGVYSSPLFTTQGISQKLSW